MTGGEINEAVRSYLNGSLISDLQRIHNQ